MSLGIPHYWTNQKLQWWSWHGFWFYRLRLSYSDTFILRFSCGIGYRLSEFSLVALVHFSGGLLHFFPLVFQGLPTSAHVPYTSLFLVTARFQSDRIVPVLLIVIHFFIVILWTLNVRYGCAFLQDGLLSKMAEIFDTFEHFNGYIPWWTSLVLTAQQT